MNMKKNILLGILIATTFTLFIITINLNIRLSKKINDIFVVKSTNDLYEVNNVILYHSANQKRIGFSSGTLIIKDSKLLEDTEKVEVEYCFRNKCRFIVGGYNFTGKNKETIKLTLPENKNNNTLHCATDEEDYYDSLENYSINVIFKKNDSRQIEKKIKLNLKGKSIGSEDKIIFCKN